MLIGPGSARKRSDGMCERERNEEHERGRRGAETQETKNALHRLKGILGHMFTPPSLLTCPRTQQATNKQQRSTLPAWQSS